MRVEASLRRRGERSGRRADIDLGIRVGDVSRFPATSRDAWARFSRSSLPVRLSRQASAMLNPIQAKRIAMGRQYPVARYRPMALFRNGETVLTELNPVVSCDKNPPVRLRARRHRAGRVSGFRISEDIAEGRLVRVFAEWTLPTGGIHAVFPPARFRPAKVRAFVELLAAAEKKRSRGLFPA